LQAVAVAVEVLVAAETSAAAVAAASAVALASCNETDPNTACRAPLNDAVASVAGIVAARLEIAIEAAQLEVAGACVKLSDAGSAYVGGEQRELHP
jgi:hypothetical protein